MSKKKRKQVETVNPSNEEYPWGLGINLEIEEIKKLGMDIENLSVGDTVNLTAIAKINNISQSDSSDGETQSIGMRLMKMRVD